MSLSNSIDSIENSFPNTPSEATKVATAHAVMRALGAEFRRFEDLKSQNPDAKIQRRLRYEYLLDINQLSTFAALAKYADPHFDR